MVDSCMLQEKERATAPLLPHTEWFTPIPVDPPYSVQEWLCDVGSMTARLKKACNVLHIKRHFEGFVATSTLGNEVYGLPPADLFWLREIEMQGDGIPWLYCRSLIPQSMLEDPELSLEHLGATPLGARLFDGPEQARRDRIYIGQVAAPLVLRSLFPESPHYYWWSRRSRLVLQQHSLILTELFFPSCPLYHTETV